MMQLVQRALGFRIRQLREEKGLTQTNFAKLCGLHRSHLGEIERGRSNMTLSSLLSIARILRVNLSVLFLDIDRRSAVKSEFNGPSTAH
jgi:transcriptional regulator with XRE-family HTH domain